MTIPVLDLSQTSQSMALTERIYAIDVIRGVALAGILLMNIEWFNRSCHQFTQGIPHDVTGIDWWAHYFVNFFVAGNFWTLFSILFGMGFAVMLTRAQSKGHAFIQPYVRRIIALFFFGLAHLILLWQGDILMSYSFTALALLMILFAQWRHFVCAVLTSFLLGLVSGFDSVYAISGLMVVTGIYTFFYRNENVQYWWGIRMPLSAIVMLVFFMIAFVIAMLYGASPATRDSQSPMLIIALHFLISFFLFRKFHERKENRALYLGVWIYVLIFSTLSMISWVAYSKFNPDMLTDPRVERKAEELRTQRIDKKTAKENHTETAIAESENKKKEPLSSEQKDWDRYAEYKVDAQESREKESKEVASFKNPRYIDFLQYRLSEADVSSASMGTLAIALFLIGYWFVRSNIMSNIPSYLPMFKKMALWGLPIGIGGSIAASRIATSAISYDNDVGMKLVTNLVHLFNLPTCLAYMSLIILALYSKGFFSKVSVFAPYGRMALTHYLSQSLIQASFFFGWGWGYYGMGRTAQLGFAIGVVVLQVIWSHIWLKYFHYGPMEWLWRAITYWTIPEFKIRHVAPN